jgi:predicted CxxxxCH...CXXCH cytochrome family protein
VTATADSAEVPVIDDSPEHVTGVPIAILDTVDTLVSSSAAYNATENTCSSVYCHGNGLSSNGDGTSDGTGMTPDWDSTTYIAGQTWDIYCNRCHGFPPKGYSGSHETMTVNDGSGCSGCHTHLNSGTDASESGWSSCCTTSGPFNDLTLHVNGNVDGGDCLGCHAQGGPGTTGPNSRRPVADEFSVQNANNYGSHHVVGVTLKTEHCGVCHGEGSYVDGTKTTKHEDGVIDLRDVDTTNSYFSYVGSSGPVTNTDIQNLDKHCLSCHDGGVNAGAKASYVQATGNTGTPADPFNDSLSNDYDQKVRSAVVNVFDQFDPGTGGTGAGNYNGNFSQHAVRGQRYGANIMSTTTVSGTLLMTGNTLLKTGQTAVDSALLSCGDCHTSGDTAIGIHGSKNEYLLRVTNGSQTDYGADALHTSAGVTTDTLVCYYCHTVDRYMNKDSGVHTSNDGDFASSVGEIGPARYADKSNKQVFGYPCAACHNAGGPEIGLNVFGGIHGQTSTTYTAGSGNSTQNRRFMPGISNDKYDGGNWTLSSSAGNSCYTSGNQTAYADCAKHTSATTLGARHVGRAIEY